MVTTREYSCPWSDNETALRIPAISCQDGLINCQQCGKEWSHKKNMTVLARCKDLPNGICEKKITGGAAIFHLVATEHNDNNAKAPSPPRRPPKISETNEQTYEIGNCKWKLRTSEAFGNWRMSECEVCNKKADTLYIISPICNEEDDVYYAQTGHQVETFVMNPDFKDISKRMKMCCSVSCAMEHSLSIRKPTKTAKEQMHPSSSSTDIEITRTTDQFRQLGLQPEIDQTNSKENTHYMDKSIKWLETIDEIQEHWIDVLNDGHFIWHNPGTGGCWPEETMWTWHGQIHSEEQIKWCARADIYRETKSDDYQDERACVRVARMMTKIKQLNRHGRQEDKSDETWSTT